MAQQSLVLPAHVANRTLPQWLLWLLPNLPADELWSCSRPDAICILPVGTKKWPSKRHTGYTSFALGCTPHWSQIVW